MTFIYRSYPPEASRLDFLIERDGLNEALNFAKRTLVSYRRHVLYSTYDKLLMRRRFIRSYLCFKQFIKERY